MVLRSVFLAGSCGCAGRVETLLVIMTTNVRTGTRNIEYITSFQKATMWVIFATSARSSRPPVVESRRSLKTRKKSLSGW
jgi:hypothetical protein